jgi:hypothetical protein
MSPESVCSSLTSITNPLHRVYDGPSHIPPLMAHSSGQQRTPTRPCTHVSIKPSFGANLGLRTLVVVADLPTRSRGPSTVSSRSSPFATRLSPIAELPQMTSTRVACPTNHESSFALYAYVEPLSCARAPTVVVSRRAEYSLTLTQLRLNVGRSAGIPGLPPTHG